MQDRPIYRAFNLGCDARLAGVPLSLNPFTEKGDHNDCAYWRMGWHDVDRWWGRLVKESWRVRPLPPVRR